MRLSLSLSLCPPQASLADTLASYLFYAHVMRSYVCLCVCVCVCTGLWSLRWADGLLFRLIFSKACQSRV
jgi:hypothetical protein